MLDRETNQSRPSAGVEQGQVSDRSRRCDEDFGRSAPNWQIDRRTRDLAMFNLAIDSKLRGCDVAASRWRRLRQAGMRSDRAGTTEKDWKGGQIELTELTHQSIDDCGEPPARNPASSSPGRCGPGRCFDN